MADLHLYIPDELRDALDDLDADVSLSEIAQQAYRAFLAQRSTCVHTRIKCADCGAFLGSYPQG